MQRSIIHRLTIIGLSLALLTSCTHDPEPIEPEPEPTESSTPDPSPPELPELATQETTEGATAFVEYYIDVLNYAAHTGDTELLESVSSPTCGGCADYITLFNERADAGGQSLGGSWSITTINSAIQGNETVHVVSLNIAEGSITENAQSDPVHYPATTDLTTLITTRENGSWTLSQFLPGDQS